MESRRVDPTVPKSSPSPFYREGRWVSETPRGLPETGLSPGRPVETLTLR